MQNQSSWIFPKALETKSSSELERAFTTIEYDFAHQSDDGGYEFPVGDSGTAPPVLSQAGSRSIFLADVGQRLRLIGELSWFSGSPDTTALRKRAELL